MSEIKRYIPDYEYDTGLQMKEETREHYLNQKGYDTYVDYTDYQALGDKWQNANAKMRSDLHKAQAKIKELESQNRMLNMKML